MSNLDLKTYEVIVILPKGKRETLGRILAVSPEKAVEGILRDTTILGRGLVMDGCVVEIVDGKQVPTYVNWIARSFAILDHYLWDLGVTKFSVVAPTEKTGPKR